MRRKLRLLAGIAAATGMLGGVALAAAPPSALTGNATSVKDTSAVLHGTVNPNGAATSYYFQWGTTTSYGTNGPTKSAGSGTKSQSVEQTAGNLKPGTTYHYRLVATSKSGTTMGADNTFTTTAPTVSTGPATQLSTSGATLTGTVNPNGKKTTWYFQWGKSGSFTQQTKAETLAAGSTPQTVTATLTGLQPATVYQYRLVASHTSGATIDGSTELLMSYPTVRPYPTVTANTKPHHRRRLPAVFTTKGTITGPSWMPDQFACMGKVRIKFFKGHHRLRSKLVPVQSNCTFSARTVFGHLPGGSSATLPEHLRITIRFRGTSYLAPRRARTEHVLLG
jgi:phosphodiesterase/alkaline phosphatase D-like protein